MEKTASQVRAIEGMSGESRIWIYQASRQIQQDEASQILSALNDFLSNWKAHGQELMAGCALLHDYFLVIALDESYEAASGCSIDTSFRTVESIGAHFDISFLDRSKVAIKTDDGVELIEFQNIPTLVGQGKIQTGTLIFNNTIQKLNQLRTQWLIPAKDSWLNRYFS